MGRLAFFGAWRRIPKFGMNIARKERSMMEICPMIELVLFCVAAVSIAVTIFADNKRRFVPVPARAGGRKRGR
jgi:hypothetical protein